MPIQPETRTDMRRTFTEVWRKLEANEPLSALEQIIADIIRLHPEYQTLLAQPDKSLDKDWTPEGGQTNPFLHMGLHIAIREQLSIDRPAGVKAVHAALLKQTGDAHAAEHVMLECLAETLWRGQREGRLPDDRLYLDCLRAQLRK